jgi:type II secretory pathway pseudopilin PulG
MHFKSQARRHSRKSERGWVMLTLLLAMALLIIFAAAIIPTITFEIKRDREEEMIHRGVQYSRAIRAYYKKFGRYPTKIEDLQSANNLRFLRKRYKDPLNCKNGKCEDFKLLHFGEVQLSLSGLGGGTIPGANPLGANGAGASPGGFSQPSAFGASSGFGANSNSSFGQNQPSTSPPPAGSDASQSGSQTPSDATGTTSSGTSSGTTNGTAGSSQLGSGQVIGGAIVGVASVVKDKTIREFNHKTKYKDWVFAYDPALDRGLLITTPYQPQLPGFGQQQNLNGQNGGQSGTGFGSGNSFGNSTLGTPNNLSSPTGGTSPPSNSPNNPSPQQ